MTARILALFALERARSWSGDATIPARERSRLDHNPQDTKPASEATDVGGLSRMSTQARHSKVFALHRLGVDEE
jgi:hypothetical protein